ncbi:hypothetical protein HCX50_19610 [Microbacterium oxydans]|uniref:hypothetical protein n=1 Tax=Microbacterium sp. B19(2022) TaxID=2914045 RepID=UPI0014318372|nr:hypothetical protein [Microbacterium sp. B19(2022)]NJI61637.1 hypothetical protein [Microbacterium sp. B19(2022)]
MSALLHLGALVPAAIGVGTLVGMRRDAGRAELLAAALMLVGMTDVMTVSLVPPVVWFAALIAAGLALAAGRRVSPVATARPGTMLSTHLALGVISTAALILLMPAMPSSAPALLVSSHEHGASSTMPQLVGAGLALGTVALDVVALRAERSWIHRLHHATMAASTIAMCAIVAT